MECGANYIFESPEQFWAELLEIISLSPSSSLDELDYALRNYVAFASAYMDEFLPGPELDHALFALLDSPLFKTHGDRMTANLIACITPSAPRSTLFITLMLVLHLGLSNPLESSLKITHALPGGLNASAKVFKALRAQWAIVVPVLMHCVASAGVVGAEDHSEEAQTMSRKTTPSDGWSERVGTAATVVLYEVCRVQRLNPAELSLFSFEFISTLFDLVERTRDAADETFNYSLIKLIIALNEQFMVSSLPAPTPGQGALPPPILPTIVGKRKPERDPNLVLEVLKRREGDSKTFGENVIFILNRSNGSPDSLCVSLLILKILYLLFTTSGTHEYFYTNDLCVLVDVFLRELCDLGEESEGLKHTYLRVLHPLLTNTQLRHHPYKRPLLRRVLLSLISNSNYQSTDPTTRRLVERNLRGTWCEGLTDDSVGEGELRAVSRKGSGDAKPVMGLGWSSGMGGSRGATTAPDEPLQRVSSAPSARGLGLHGGTETAGSTLSVDAVAQAEDYGAARRTRHRKKTSVDSPAISVFNASPDIASSSRCESPLATNITLDPVTEGVPFPPHGSLEAPVRPAQNRQRSMSLVAPRPQWPATTSSFSDSPPLPSHPHLLAPSSPPATRASSTDGTPRRRRPPPPPQDASRPRTPSYAALPASHPLHVSHPPPSPSPVLRRAAPEPPSFKSKAHHVADVTRVLDGLALKPCH